MDWLNAIGSIASIIGLIATFYTLYKVTNLPTALKQQSRDKQLSELIDRITRIPPAKPTIPDSTAREIEALIRNVRLYYISIIPFKQRKLKSLLTTLEAELSGQKQLRVVQQQLRLIRDEITIR
jgi:hypothetical protein